MLEIASLLKKLYSTSSQTHNVAPLDQLCREYIFKYSIDDEAVEENSLLGYKKMMKNYHSNEALTPEM